MDVSEIVERMERAGYDFCDHELELLNNRTWTSINMDLIHVSDMSTQTIRQNMAIIRYSKNLRLDRLSNMWIEVFEEELTQRQKGGNVAENKSGIRKIKKKTTKLGRFIRGLSMDNTRSSEYE